MPYLTRSTALPGVRSAHATALIEDLVISQDFWNKELIFASFGPPERLPRTLGPALFGDSTLEGDLWADGGVTPQLIPAGEGSFYVTGHPNSEVWAFP